MKIARSSKTRYFLIELLIVIAFFAVASTVCVQVFAHAHLISVESQALSRGVGAAQSAAEVFQASKGDRQQMARLLGGELQPDGAIHVFYNEDWEAASSGDGYYQLTMGVEGERLLTAAVQVTQCQDGALIYEMETKQFVG